VPDGEPFDPMKAADLGEMVFEADLVDGMRLRAFRDGMLAFDFAPWGNRPPGRLSEAKAEVEYQTRCVRLMNVHLACLYVALSGGLQATVLTPNRLISVAFSDGRFMGGSDMLSLELFLARKAVVLGHEDWRRRRNPQPIWIEAMQESVDRLKQLLNRDRQDVALLRADMLYRSVSAFQNFDYAAALVNAWTTIEALLGDELDAYLTELDESREVEGDDETFINSKRFKFYRGSDVTSKLTAEVLSLADRLDFSLYRSVLKSAKARNNWLHNQQPSENAAEDARDAIFTATKLFGLSEGVELPMHVSTPLHRV